MQVIKPNTVGLTDGTFTRASTGTYTDIDGIVKTAAINVPRFQYDFGTNQFQGVLFEPAITNLITYSQDLDNAAWVKTQTTVTANATTAPDNTVTADKLLDSTVLGNHFVQSSSVSLAVGVSYVFSVFVKAAELSNVLLSVGGTGWTNGVQPSARFNLQTGTITSNTASVTFIRMEKYANGWYRCSIGSTATAVSSQRVAIGTMISPTTPAYAGDGVSGIFVWGVQFEAASSSTSYIPTVAATVTRSADTITGTNLLYSSATDPNAVWSSATTYSLGQKVRYQNQVYESLQNTNLNRQPDTNPTWWLNLGYDNIHAQFDASTSTPTTATAELTFLVKQSEIDSIALVNLDCFVAEVAVLDQTTGTLLFSATYGLTGGNVVDWYQYFFFDPITKRSQIVIPGLPSVVNTLVSVRIKTSPGTPVSLGTYIGGETTVLGTLQMSPSIGIIDYSRKDTDEFGKTTFVQRAYSKRMSAEIWFDNTELNKVQRYLTSIRATPVVWVGSTDPDFEEALVVYGFYRDFQTTIAYPQVSMCSLEIEGLT